MRLHAANVDTWDTQWKGELIAVQKLIGAQW